MTGCGRGVQMADRVGSVGGDGEGPGRRHVDQRQTELNELRASPRCLGGGHRTRPWRRGEGWRARWGPRQGARRGGVGVGDPSVGSAGSSGDWGGCTAGRGDAGPRRGSPVRCTTWGQMASLRRPAQSSSPRVCVRVPVSTKRNPLPWVGAGATSPPQPRAAAVPKPFGPRDRFRGTAFAWTGLRGRGAFGVLSGDSGAFLRALGSSRRHTQRTNEATQQDAASVGALSCFPATRRSPLHPGGAPRARRSQ